MSRQYAKVTVHLPEEYHELVASLIDDPAFRGAESQAEQLHLWFEHNSNVTARWEKFIEQCLHRLHIPVGQITTENVPSVDWYEAWQATLQPVVIDQRLLIVPWHERKDNALADYRYPLVITIEPRMAFGTGHHPTTQMCALLLLDTVRPNEDWLDVGCGSGVLAIIAAKLGAKRVLAIDSDPDAITECQDNVARNCCLSTVECYVADIFTYKSPKMDGIVANLYDTLLERLAGSFAQWIRSGGHAIVSGILTSQADTVVHAFRNAGFELDRQLRTDEWTAFRFVRL
ncbi:MAG: 50S ribosomal protein L11 methyltransferase [Bacteroidota bacterium]|nr:50S ribosomal protein L11 methyltransferase [Candidatus Kapabacteria bacterium]MCX7936285.1 50S ribosomal protein L11 methyltransferase [Chlorobiota bacterium]MDW8271090.1 50S ribosomal protein L11 methyltransferase [Bacteroidota bacterium]